MYKAEKSRQEYDYHRFMEALGMAKQQTKKEQARDEAKKILDHARKTGFPLGKKAK